MRTAAILPVKRFAAAKSRLGASGVAETLRERLARAMVTDVLLALEQVEAIEQTLIVTSEPSLLELAAGPRARLIEDSVEDGQSAAVALGIRRALSEGIERVICIPGDCPALEPSELEALLAHAGDGPEVTIVPDRHGTGTNGLLLTAPDVIEPAFGPGSCERHAMLARDAGVSWRIERPASLLLDVDTGEDLAALRDRLGATRAAATRTRAVLGQPESHPILSIIETD
jgi:2-phospho-L-lactate guanylyltransferase